MEVFKQPAYSPIPVEIQAGIMWAVQNDFFDSIDTAKITEAVGGLREYLTTRGSEVTAKILKEKAITDEIDADLRNAVEEWKRGFGG